ncbi:MAG: hypothetical protein WAZ94_05620 [Phycisphaerales bacterium]
MRHRAVVASVIAAFVTPVLAQNIALNKPVSIVAGAGSVLPPAAPPSVVTDGVFLNEATPYSDAAAVAGSIRWNTGAAGSATIEIQLGGLFSIDGIIVQADDNDALAVSYLGPEGTFLPLYNVPYVSVGFGFRTRPGASHVTYANLTPVETTTIRVTNAGGDGYYGISELQLRGVPVSPPCDPDLNQDGNVDQDDVGYLINVVGGGDNPSGIDPDFNQDGNVDQDDVTAIINVVAGGECP